MSEKQAKKQRKTQPEEAKKHTKGKSSAGFNAVLALIVVAVLALGGYALVSSYLENKANQPSDDTGNTTQTVAQYAQDAGMTADEFLTAYGLEGNEEITADTDINTATGAMTVEKFAEFSETTVDELKEQYGLGDEVTNDMIWNDVQNYVPIGKWCEMSGIDFAEFLTNYGLTEEELPRDTKFGDAMPILQEAAAAMQAEQEAQNDTDADAVQEENASAASQQPEQSPEAE